MIYTQTVRPARNTTAVAPVPLDPWVPIGSAISVALLAIFWRLRRRAGH